MREAHPYGAPAMIGEETRLFIETRPRCLEAFSLSLREMWHGGDPVGGLVCRTSLPEARTRRSFHTACRVRLPVERVRFAADFPAGIEQRSRRGFLVRRRLMHRQRQAVRAWQARHVARLGEMEGHGRRLH